MPCHFGEEEAKAWVSTMAPAAKWTMKQTTAVMHQKGYDHKPCEFWAVMNMLYSDYGKVMAKCNADKPEIRSDMADAWITDPDARPHITGRYYRDVVDHEIKIPPRHELPGRYHYLATTIRRNCGVTKTVGGAEGQPVLVTKFSREYIYSFRNRVSMPFDRSE